MSVCIYILQLEHNKYYIGKTTNPSFRLSNHFNHKGSNWTRIHKPIKVLELIENCDQYDEDKYTIKYMDKYGIQNVRGGSFVTIKLSENTINHINRMICSANNKCFHCGDTGHFINECPDYINENKHWCVKLCELIQDFI